MKKILLLLSLISVNNLFSQQFPKPSYHDRKHDQVSFKCISQKDGMQNLWNCNGTYIEKSDTIIDNRVFEISKKKFKYNDLLCDDYRFPNDGGFYKTTSIKPTISARYFPRWDWGIEVEYPLIYSINRVEHYVYSATTKDDDNRIDLFFDHNDNLLMKREYDSQENIVRDLYYEYDEKSEFYRSVVKECIFNELPNRMIMLDYGNSVGAYSSWRTWDGNHYFKHGETKQVFRGKLVYKGNYETLYVPKLPEGIGKYTEAKEKFATFKIGKWIEIDKNIEKHNEYAIGQKNYNSGYLGLMFYYSQFKTGISKEFLNGELIHQEKHPSIQNQINELIDNEIYKSKVQDALLQKRIDEINQRKNNENKIPLIKENGMNYVYLTINNTKYKYLIDTGASLVVIDDEMKKLFDSKNLIIDYEGEKEFKIADGSLYKIKVAKLKSLKIGDIKIENVKIAIVDNNSTLLLGMSLLNKFNWRITNDYLFLD